jgi:hypothetical protein
VRLGLGEPGQQYPCWSVLEDDASRIGIAYCESGFGPGQPWGLVWLGGVEQTSMSMGMDSGRYSTFLDAVFESRAVAPLPIWRVFRSDASGDRRSITGEDTWETTWERVAEYRKADPASRYDCDHRIACGR